MALCGLNRCDGGRVLCSLVSRAGNWLGDTQEGVAVRRRRKEKRAVLFLSLGFALPHSAVASQLVPRVTWRHLVSVSTGAGTADGCGRFRSAPVAAEEAADARLQGVTGVVTPERENAAGKSQLSRIHF